MELIGHINSNTNLKANLEGVVKIYPTLENLTITPSKNEQEFTHPNSYGYNKVNVKGIKLQNKRVNPKAFDQEITADNIYQGLEEVIVEGINLQNKSVTPLTTTQTVNADSNYSGLNTVTVTGVTHSIDENIESENIKKDVVILRDYWKL